MFKVKKRGEFQYSRITKAVEDDNLQFDFKPFGVQTELPFFDDFGKKRLAYSYNYPYDFCSLIELAKVDAQYDLFGKILNLNPPVTEAEEEPVAERGFLQPLACLLQTGHWYSGLPGCLEPVRPDPHYRRLGES